mmetsp:Transcript_44261/g.103480  ORF Transcript_44261/g.103480 Transcript_44261/m.103480 type:complete len:216 (+) Transcript_44261:385-1032(+)
MAALLVRASPELEVIRIDLLVPLGAGNILCRNVSRARVVLAPLGVAALLAGAAQEALQLFCRFRGPKRLWHAVDGAAHQRRAALLVAPSMPFHAKAALVSLLHPFRRVAALPVVARLLLAALVVGASHEALPSNHGASPELKAGIALELLAHLGRAAAWVTAAQDCFGLRLPFRRRFAAVLLAELRDAAVLQACTNLGAFVSLPLVRGLAVDVLA